VSGQKISLARGVEIEVLDRVLPDKILAFEGDDLSRSILEGVASLLLKPRPQLVNWFRLAGPTRLRHLLAAAEAVAFAHQQGVVHRDLKPANILVGNFGETQVMDWGLALPLDPIEQEDPAVAQGIVGTPDFMAPEQTTGKTVDTRADVWSLGATLQAILLPPVAPELQAIVLRTTAADPKDRYPSAREFAEDLARYLDGRRVEAYSYTAGELLARLLKLWRAPLLVAAAALVVVTGIGATAAFRILQARDQAVAAKAQTRQALIRSDQHLSQLLSDQKLVVANPNPSVGFTLSIFSPDGKELEKFQNLSGELVVGSYQRKIVLIELETGIISRIVDSIVGVVLGDEGAAVWHPESGSWLDFLALHQRAHPAPTKPGRLSKNGALSGSAAGAFLCRPALFCEKWGYS
jgi:hypothetical protein